MSTSYIRVVAPLGLVVGAVLGIAGTFVSSASVRGVAWGLDGTALVLAAALLAVHHFRKGNDTVAAGFLVFLAGQTLVDSGSAMDLETSAPIFAAGAGLWATALVLISTPKVMPLWVRGVGFIAAILFAWMALQVYSGHVLTSLSRPLPFFAYPFLAATLFGWAWAHYRDAP